MKGHILAITPSPALDLSGVVEGIRPNEKNYVHDELKSPGGNAVNAARVLTRLRTPVIASGFLGGGAGEEILALLQKEKVRCHFIPIAGTSRMNVTVSNREDGQQTRLTFPGPAIRRGELQKLFKWIEQDRQVSLLLLGGSLPAGFKTTDLRRLLRWAHQKNIPTIVDSPSVVLKEIVTAKPFLIKPNLIEFQEMTGTSVTKIPEVVHAAQKYLKDIPWVCVSSVEGGALLIGRSSVHFGKIGSLKIRSTVGAGDSMTGAMTGQIFRGNLDGADLLRWGLAASAATLAQPGTAFGQASEIRAFYQKIQIKRLK